jgi:hypothetical protein
MGLLYNATAWVVVAMFTCSALAMERCASFEQMTTGTWIHTDKENVSPGYAHCKMDMRQDCRSHGEGVEYTKYKWLPSSCMLDDFDNQAKVATCLQGHRIAFVGDSLSRNQMVSLQCMLTTSDKINFQGYSDGYRIDADTHDEALDVHLVKHDSFELHDLKEGALSELLHMNYSVIVLGTGGWWGYGGQDRHFEVTGQFETMERFRTRLRPGVRVLSQLAQHATVIWRVPDLSHWNNPDQPKPWLKSGMCPKGEPSTAALALVPAYQLWLRDVIVQETAGKGIHIFDVSMLSGSRADAHPSAHMNKTVEGHLVADCQHWCLPGVPDTWNQIVLNFICRSKHVEH